MFFKVPVINGTLDIDYEYMEQGVQSSETEAYIKLRKGFTTRESWRPITEEEWLSVQPPEPEPVPPPETTEQKLARLEEQNLILMDALATTFEELLELRAIVEGGTV
jgi:hypothetical protein